MSKIIQNLYVAPTRQRTVDQFESLKLHVEPTQSAVQTNWRETYRLVGVLEVEFSANTAEYEHAKEAAKRMLVHQLYGDTLAYLSKLEHYLYSGSRHDIQKIISEIRSNLTEIK